MRKKPYPDSPVLIVDDEKIILQSIDFSLRSGGITNVEYCQKSNDVLPRLKKKKYSLILLDLTMRGIGGKELLSSIVREYPDTPVIIITGKIDGETQRYCISHGASYFLKKPVAPSRLINAVRSVLGTACKKENKSVGRSGEESPLLSTAARYTAGKKYTSVFV